MQDLTSVQNLQKKHALLEADVAAHQVSPRPLHVLACYFSINLVSYIIDIIMTCHSLALFSTVIISCLQWILIDRFIPVLKIFNGIE